jgi:DNA-binding XRE family transcriptional regulator
MPLALCADSGTTMSEHTRAAAWRKSLGLTQQQLAHAIGFSRETIYWYERGETPPTKGAGSKPQPAWIWRRYKLACAGLAAQLKSGKPFDWEAE